MVSPPLFVVIELELAKVRFVKMKFSILCVVVGLSCCLANPGAAQVRLGIKGGLSTSMVPSSSLIILNQSDVESLKLKVDNAKYGIHLGMFIQAQTEHLFLQPELLFNTVSYDFAIEDLQGINPRQIKDELYRSLDLPLILGFKFGPVRIGGGPVVHLFLDSTSDLTDFPDYTQDFQRLSYGWQAGLGLDIWKLHLDARYEGNFSNFGDHIVFYNRHYSFRDKASRILVSAGISF